MSNILFSALKNAKITPKHISTKVSFKFTIRKTHVYIDIGWPWIWNQYFYFGIWNDDRTKLIILQSFQLVTWINSQNGNETDFMNPYPTAFPCGNATFLTAAKHRLRCGHLNFLRPLKYSQNWTRRDLES